VRSRVYRQSFNHLKLHMKKSAVFSENVPPVKVP